MSLNANTCVQIREVVSISIKIVYIELINITVKEAINLNLRLSEFRVSLTVFPGLPKKLDVLCEFSNMQREEWLYNLPY